MRQLVLVALLALLVIPAIAAQMSDAEVKRATIQQSLAAYPGPCPCPYNRARIVPACASTLERLQQLI
jgi:hypothetical protein